MKITESFIHFTFIYFKNILNNKENLNSYQLFLNIYKIV